MCLLVLSVCISITIGENMPVSPILMGKHILTYTKKILKILVSQKVEALKGHLGALESPNLEKVICRF